MREADKPANRICCCQITMKYSHTKNKVVGGLVKQHLSRKQA